MRISSAQRAGGTSYCCAAVAICKEAHQPGSAPQKKWGPALLPAPTAPSEGSAKSLVSGPRGTLFKNFGSPAQASLPIRLPPPGEEPDSPTAVTGPKTRFRFDPSSLAKPELSDVPRPFLGWPRFAFRFAHQRSEDLREPRPATERPSLPAPLPGWFPESPEGNFPIACRRRSGLRPPAASSFRFRLSDEAGTAVPITHAQCTSPPSRGSEIIGCKPVDYVDIG